MREVEGKGRWGAGKEGTEKHENEKENVKESVKKREVPR